jgi:hypothetical protein
METNEHERASCSDLLNGVQVERSRVSRHLVMAHARGIATGW